jgi:hypothetical protein
MGLGRYFHKVGLYEGEQGDIHVNDIMSALSVLILFTNLITFAGNITRRAVLSVFFRICSVCNLLCVEAQRI